MKQLYRIFNLEQLYLGIIIVGAFMLFNSCGSKSDFQIQSAIIENKKASDFQEWEFSEYHPKIIFEELRKSNLNEKKKNEICKKLNSLDPAELSLFENEIQNEENAEILSLCQKDLIKKLDEHWTTESQKMEVPAGADGGSNGKNDFVFETKIARRNVSRGYVAVTGDVNPKQVILSFDDGPSGKYTTSILKSLREVNAKAHFFAIGKNAKLNAEILRQVALDGHTIGSHSFSHSCIAATKVCDKFNLKLLGHILSRDQAFAEIKNGHQEIYNILGFVDPFFRFPFGETSPEIKQFLKDNGTAEVSWVIDSEDWKAGPNQAVINNVLNQLQKQNRGIILFHDTQRKTAEIMPQLLKELYNRGYQVVIMRSDDSEARYNSSLIQKITHQP